MSPRSVFNEKPRVGMVALDQIRVRPNMLNVDLGDVRPLANSLERYSMIQPVSVEVLGDFLRLRIGHHRVAAARMMGWKRVPALIYTEALDERDWLEFSAQENVHRTQVAPQERRRIIADLRALNAPWQDVADVFGVSVSTVHSWLSEKKPRKGPTPARRATDRLVAKYRDEWEALVAQEQAADAEASQDTDDDVEAPLRLVS